MRLPEKTKPSKVLFKDGLRPVLEAAHLREEHGRAFLYATNSFSFIRLELDTLPEGRGREGTQIEGVIPAVALRHMEKGVNFVPKEETVAVGRLSEYRRVFSEADNRSEGDFPDWAKLVPDVKKSLRVGLSAKLLHELAQAMAAEGDHVTLEFDLEQTDSLNETVVQTYNRAIKVEPMRDRIEGRERKGLLMPVKVQR